MATSSAGLASSVPIPGHLDSLFGRVAGMINTPRATLQAVIATPRWLGVMAVTFAVTAVSSAILLGTEVGQLALLDQWERTAIAFGQNVDDAQYAALEQATRNGVLYAAVSALAGGPLLTIALSIVLYSVFSLALHGPGTFRQVLAVAAHAQVVLALRQVIATPVNYARETLASPTTATAFFPMLDEASPAARFLGVIDLCVVWWIILLATGVSVLYGGRQRTLILAFIGTYVVLALLLVAAMAVTGGTT